MTLEGSTATHRYRREDLDPHSRMRCDRNNACRQKAIYRCTTVNLELKQASVTLRCYVHGASWAGKHELQPVQRALAAMAMS